MFNLLCVLLITSLCWQNVTSRHLVQPSSYSPQTDYSYKYMSPIHFQPHFLQQAHHSALYSPPGTYFDQRQGILRPFPGGGVPVLVDYHKRCSNQYVGLKAHPEQQQYYYVCKPDCVIFGKCQNLQIFNATRGQCVQHPPPEYIPTCTGPGRFPLFSDCHLYYKCEEDLQPRIYSCPETMIFSPVSKKCINGNKCTPTQISPHSSYIPEYCTSKFPPCFENGIFRSPSDCSLYYKCDLKNNGIYIQTRLRCPRGNFYDLQKNKCLPAEEVPCDCIQVAELVYPKPNTLSFQPEVYPAQFDLDSFEDNQYPVEHIKEELNNNGNKTESESDGDGDADRDVNTTLTPIAAETTLGMESDEQNDIEARVLSERINIGRRRKLKEIVVSSEEETSAEGSGLEEDSVESTASNPESKNTDQTINEIKTTSSDVTSKEEEEEETSTTDDAGKEITHELDNPVEEPQKTSTDEIKTTNPQEEEATTIRNLDDFTQPEFCENMIESNEDTQTHTQNEKCLPNLTTTSSNTDSESPKILPSTRDSRSTLHQQNSTVHNSITTQLPTTNLTRISDNLETVQLRNENALVPEKEILLHTEKNFEIGTTTQSWEQKTTEHSTHNPDTGSEDPQDDDYLILTTLKTTSEDTIQTVNNFAVNTSSMENDISYEDITDEEITSSSFNENTERPLVETVAPAGTTQLEKGPDITQAAKRATTQPNLHKSNNEDIDIQSNRILLGNKELQEVEKKLKPEITTIKSESTATTFKPPPDETAVNRLNSKIDDEFDLLDSKKKIGDFESLPPSEGNFNRSLPLDKELLPRQDDFLDEEFIPVHSKLPVLNELPDETTDLNFIGENIEKGFDDDYTTVSDLADKETAFSAVTIATTKGSLQQDQIAGIKRETKDDDTSTTNVRRRQTSATTTEKPNAITKTTTTTKAEENLTIEDSFKASLDISDSEIVIHSRSEEVSNNEITSAETIPIDNLKQQFPQTPSTTITPTQTPTTTPKYIPDTSPKVSKPINATTEPNEKQTNNLVLHVREDQEQKSLDSPTGKSLYYILKTIPVINNSNNNNNNVINNKNDTKSNNTTVTAPPFIEQSDNGTIPRLDIIAERPINIHFSICSTACDKEHKHNFPPSGKRAVLLKWFPNKSNQTLAFETADD